MIEHEVEIEFSSDEISYVWKRLCKAEKEVGFWPEHLEGYCDYFSYKRYLVENYLEEDLSVSKYEGMVKGWIVRLRGYNRIVN